jgi:hypothetical protein
LYGKQFLLRWYQDELTKVSRNQEKEKGWLSKIGDFGRVEDELVVKWMICFAL